MAVSTNILLETGTNELEVVEFILRYTNRDKIKVNQSYGINVAKVREIIRIPQLTKLPNLPDGVYGVFNLRGIIIPALDLCNYLYSEPNKESNSKMIIAEFNKMMIGFIVNDVQRIHRTSWDQITASETIHEFDGDKSSIIGIIRLGDRNILMLDVEKIIADINPLSAMDNVKSSFKLHTKPKVITAEDSGVIRKLISDRLLKAGFEIISFRDGMEAWEKLQEIADFAGKGANLSDYVNVVITDIEMPRMDGYTLTRLIKENKTLAQIPVVIFSSIVSAEVAHKGKAVGADAQLTKPQIGELLETVRFLIEKE